MYTTYLSFVGMRLTPYHKKRIDELHMTVMYLCICTLYTCYVYVLCFVCEYCKYYTRYYAYKESQLTYQLVSHCVHVVCYAYMLGIL